MAQTLAESAKLSTNQLAKGVLEIFVQESSVLDRIPFMDIEGNAFQYNEEATLPGVAFRAVNEAYAESVGTVNQKTEGLKIMGGDADVDTFIAKTRSNLEDQRAQATKGKVKAINYGFQKAFINGDSEANAKEFDGLKKRLVNSQVMTADVNGMGVVTAGHDFLDALDALIAQVPGCNALYMNSLIRAKLQSSARRLGGWINVDEIATGKVIATYNGIPLLNIGEDLQGNSIIPQTEVCGNSNVTSSIYAVKFGEDEQDQGVTGLWNGGVDVRDLGEMESTPAFRTRVELFAAIAVFGGKGAARLKGVLNS